LGVGGGRATGWPPRRALALAGLAAVIVVGVAAAGRVTAQSADTVACPLGLPPAGKAARVLRVMDGDTIRVAYEDERDGTVRYLGINAPERSRPFYHEATAANEALVDGADVFLEADELDEDSFNRQLRYVYLTDGTFVNAQLLADGMAVLDVRPPNDRWHACLALHERMARRAQTGLWLGRVFLPFLGDPRWCVDLNTASSEQLQLIVHIGPERARQIMEGRPWQRVEDLDQLPGIGAQRLRDILAQGLACVR